MDCGKHIVLSVFTMVGKLIGNFYDTKGNPTEALREAEAGTNRALEEKRLTEEERKIFPPCNSHWSEATGSKLWCSTKRYLWELVISC